MDEFFFYFIDAWFDEECEREEAEAAAKAEQQDVDEPAQSAQAA